MLGIAWILSSAVGVTLAWSTTNSSSCVDACGRLERALKHGQVFTTATAELYWAEQIQEIQPACFVAPANVKEVSLVVRTARKTDCQFAIRGGGHGDVPGANNLAGGLVLDLGSLQEVTVSEDRRVARVGAGNRWGNVYNKLDPLNLTVVGGRESGVGVAGLTLGGGFSYFSGQKGLACDNVHNFEVVLADGRIVNANENSHRHLYRALRGGGNNFGVVTRFDLDTIEYHLMHGGLVVWADSPTVAKEQIQAFVNYAHDAPSDPDAHLFAALGSSAGGYFWSVGIYYDRPYGPGGRPKIFDGYYTATLNASQIYSSERNTNHSSLAQELGTTQPSGMRNQFHTNTFAVDLDLITAAFEIFREETNKTNAQLAAQGRPPASTVLALQVLSSNVLSHGAGADGNVLGLDVNDAPLALVSMAWPWEDAADDNVYNGGMQAVVDRTNAEAQARGLANKFIYMNYAQQGSQVIASYGGANRRFLQDVSKKYDPTGVFQRLVPGGFKL